MRSSPPSGFSSHTGRMASNIVSDMKAIDSKPDRYRPCCREIQRSALWSGKVVARTSNSQVEVTAANTLIRMALMSIVFVIATFGVGVTGNTVGLAADVLRLPLGGRNLPVFANPLREFGDAQRRVLG